MIFCRRHAVTVAFESLRRHHRRALSKLLQPLENGSLLLLQPFLLRGSLSGSSLLLSSPVSTVSSDGLRNYSLFRTNHHQIITAFERINSRLLHYYSSTPINDRQYNRGGNNNRHNRRINHQQRWDVRQCQSVQELLETTIDKLETSPPSTLVAAWNYFPVLLRNTTNPPAAASTTQHVQENGLVVNELEHQIAYLMHRTIHSFHTFRPRDVTTVILSLAKIIRQIRSQIQHLHHRKELDVSHEAFRNILLLDGDNNEQQQHLQPNHELFKIFSEEVNRNLSDYDPRCLSNVMYAHAIMEYGENPLLTNGTSCLFDNIAHAAIHQMHKFETQGISNTLWSFAKLNKGQSLLFQCMGDYMTDSLESLREFKPQELSNILWAYATLHEYHGGFFEKAVDAILELDYLHRCKPQELSNILWSYATVQHVDPNLFHSIGDHIVSLDDTLDTFNSQCISNIVLAYAKANIHHPALFNKIAKCIGLRDGLKHFNSQSIANILWAYASLAESNTEMFHAIGDTICNQQRDKILYRFKPQELSNTVWSFATANVRHVPLFENVGRVIVERGGDLIADFKPQELANIVWAYATAEMQCHDVFRKIGDSVLTSNQLKLFNAQELSNTVWAYATANMHHPGLFQRIGNDIVGRDGIIETFKPQELSSTVWSYAKANISHPGLFTCVGNAIVGLDNLEAFKPQELVNIVWAYASLGEHHPFIYQCIGDEIITRDLSTFNSQNLSNLVWAYASIDIKHPKLLESVSNAIVSRLDNNKLDSFGPQSISNILWAYAKANVYHPILFNRLQSTILGMKDLNDFKPQELSNLLWAFAKVNELQPDLLKKVTDEIMARNDLKSFTPQSLANISWSCAVADSDESTLFNIDYANAIVEKQSDFSDEALSQLHQWHLWQFGEKSNTGLPGSELQQRCYQIFIGSKFTSSQFQQDVVKELKLIGLDPKEEYLTNSGYRLDALVEINGRKFGIEADGPSHFIDRKVNGSTALRRRQAAAIDSILIISVPYWDWEEFGNDRSKKQQYLQSLLKLS